MQKQVIHNQSLFDVAVQEDGSVMAAFERAFINGLSVTDELAPGRQLIDPISVFKNRDVANYFEGKNQMIATGFNGSDNTDIIPQLGIGRMAIGTTFIVR
jgi:hypothetical protein